MHVIPQLRALEGKYRDVLAVVGVHSAKFPAERDTANVREAVLRYGVAHPVVNDRDFVIWRTYGCRAWPTLIFIDPASRLIGKHEGELPVPEFDRLIGQMTAEFDASGLLDRRPLHFRRESELEAPSALAFPGKVLADEASCRLFIADSHHHRIVVAGLNGVVQRVIGDGTPGLRDGTPNEARFTQPQGLALDRDSLFVADTENHAVRRIDLADDSVTTVAGTGEQGTGARGGGPARLTALSSPWDVVIHHARVLIAMAGFHQIWSLDPAAGLVVPWAGSGREELGDGSLTTAQFAQPSDLATDGALLFVADSEASAVRAIDPEAKHVTTLVGRGLFEFGDEDGTGDDVLLQHPLGLAWTSVGLLVADSYNNKLKLLNPQSRRCVTFAGEAAGGRTDGPAIEARFREPSGLSAAGRLLFIADTNNHAIRVLDLQTRAVSTVQFAGL